MTLYKSVPITGGSSGIGAALTQTLAAPSGRIILRGAAGKIRVAFPWWMAALAHIAGLLPPRILGKLLPDLSGEPA